MAAHYPPCLNYVDIPNTFFNIFTRAAVYLANIVLIITNQDIVVADSHIHSDFFVISCAWPESLILHRLLPVFRGLYYVSQNYTQSVLLSQSIISYVFNYNKGKFLAFISRSHHWCYLQAQIYHLNMQSRFIAVRCWNDI